MRPGLDSTREGHHMRVGMLDQALADGAAPGNDLHQPGRQRIERGDELQRGQGREVRRLDDHRVAARDGGSGLPAQQAERIIERQDDHDHAQGILGREVELAVHRGAQHFAVFVPGDFGVIVDRTRRPRHLVERLLVGFAHFAGQHFRHQRPIRHHPPRYFVQQFGAPMMVHIAPAALCGVGGGHRLIDICRGRVGDFARGAPPSQDPTPRSRPRRSNAPGARRFSDIRSSS